MTAQEISGSRSSQTMVALIARMEGRVRERFRQMRLRQAIKRAYARFAPQHPGWVAGLFDEHFLFHHGWATLSCGTCASPSDLAWAWYAQCAPPQGTMGTRKQAEATAVAATFLTYLHEELQPTVGGQATMSNPAA